MQKAETVMGLYLERGRRRAVARRWSSANDVMRTSTGSVLNVGRRGGKSLESRGEIERLMPGSGRGCRKSAFR